MKLSNIRDLGKDDILRDLSKDDILSAVGLASKPSTTEKMLGGVGFFGLGLLVGAGTALLLAPKSGIGLREDLGERLRELRNREFRSSDGARPDHAQTRKTDSREEVITELGMPK